MTVRRTLLLTMLKKAHFYRTRTLCIVCVWKVILCTVTFPFPKTDLQRSVVPMHLAEQCMGRKSSDCCSTCKCMEKCLGQERKISSSLKAVFTKCQFLCFCAHFAIRLVCHCLHATKSCCSHQRGVKVPRLVCMLSVRSRTVLWELAGISSLHSLRLPLQPRLIFSPSLATERQWTCSLSPGTVRHHPGLAQHKMLKGKGSTGSRNEKRVVKH